MLDFYMAFFVIFSQAVLNFNKTGGNRQSNNARNILHLGLDFFKYFKINVMFTN